jgi:uncharacterized protein (TIGR02594 family)
MTQPRWLTLAWTDLGVAETPGPNHTARVVGYYADVGHPQVTDDETAWCAAFLGSCLERAGVPSTRSLMARSYLDWGQPLRACRHGAVAVLSRTADPALGHVGFLVGETADAIILLGGNQGNRVRVESFPRMRLLAVRWPVSLPPPVLPDAECEARSNPGPGAAGGPLFDRALAHVLDMEGGWADDPHDPGGPTNFGITLAAYARHKGVQVTAANAAQLEAELRAIPQATVRRIYHEGYWRPASCPALPASLALFHFDAAVNQGVAAAARMLQEAVGATIDGEIGPETLASAAGAPMAQALARYADIRRRHYRSLPTFWRFGKGWLARTDRSFSAANAAAGTPVHSPQQPQQEIYPMTEDPAAADTTKPPNDATAVKWWGHSMTIWGAVITTLSTVLPTVGPLLGLDITPELARQLGDQVVLAVQAVGGLAGTILTIYGRVRATTTLERRQMTLTM